MAHISATVEMDVFCSLVSSMPDLTPALLAPEPASTALT